MSAYTLYCTDCETETFTDSSGRCSCGSGRVMVQWQDKVVKTKIERQPNLEAEERKEFEKWAAKTWPNSHPPAAAWIGWKGRAGLG